MMRSNKTNYIDIAIIDFICRIKFQSYKYWFYFKQEYYSKSVTKKPVYTISIKINDKKKFTLNMTMNNADVEFPSSLNNNKKGINYLVRTLISFFALQNNILLLHGSSFVKDKSAYIFCGPSGVGKSTILKQVKETEILGDDTVIIKKDKKNYFVFTSQFDNVSYPKLIKRKIPLKKIFIPIISKKTQIFSLHYIDSFGEILKNNICYNFLNIHMLEKRLKLNQPNTLINIDFNFLRKIYDKLYILNFDLISNIPVEKLMMDKKFKIYTIF